MKTATRPRPIPSLSPATMKGSAEGNSTRRKISNLDALKDRAASIRLASVYLIPAVGLMRIGKTTRMKTIAIVEAGPIPKARMRIGEKATSGVA